MFDTHFHIIDFRFPVQENQGFMPPSFPVASYRSRTRDLGIAGGCIVAGSFQGFDTGCMLDALAQFGPTFVGVVQIPASASDEEIRKLDAAGVRGVRFNLVRGGAASVADLDRLARRVHDLAGWHAELYADARDLEPIYATLVALPAVSIAHLGLSKAGLPTLLRLAERGMKVKATGFGRGIAAPQIGSLRRMIFIRMQPTGFCGPLINPEIVRASDDRIELWDDCFSFPDLMVRVSRSAQVRVRYLDERGSLQTVEAEGDLSELLQHEIDHLDGILAVQRALTPRSFCTRAEWERRFRRQ